MSSTPADEQRAFVVVKHQLLAVVPEIEPDLVTPQAALVDLGAGSLDRLDVVVGAIEELGLTTPAHHFAGARTTGELVRLLVEEVRACPAVDR